MKVGQKVQVCGNGIKAVCEVYAVDFSGYRSDYVQVKHPCGKVYFVQIKNCRGIV